MSVPDYDLSNTPGEYADFVEQLIQADHERRSPLCEAAEFVDLFLVPASKQ